MSLAPSTGLRRRLFGPTVAGWIAILGRVIGVAIVIPIAFRTLSPPDTVLWLFFTTAVNFQAILDFGHNITFARFIAYARAKSGQPQPGAAAVALPTLPVLLNIIGSAYLRVTAGTALVAGLILSWMARQPIAASSHPLQHWLVWSVVCASLIIQTYGGRFIAVLQGFERVAVQRWIEAGLGVISNVVAGVLLVYSKTLAPAAVGSALVGVGAACAYALASRRSTAGFSSSMPEFEPAALVDARRQIWHAAWRSGVGILCSTGLIQMMGLSVSNLAPPARAASFMFAMRIAQVISALSQSPFYNHLPTLARKFREHDMQGVKSDARSRMLSATLIVAMGFVTTGVLAPPVLQRLGSKTDFVELSIWVALGFAFLAERVGAMHMQLYTLGGRVIWHWVNGLTGMGMLAGTFLLYRSLGLIAFPLSMFAVYVAIYCSISIVRSYRLLGLEFLRFDAIASVPAASILALFALKVASTG